MFLPFSRREYLWPMRFVGLTLFLLFTRVLLAQQGTLTGTVSDEKNNGLDGATVQLISFIDLTPKVSAVTDKNGLFSLAAIPFGYYKLSVSFAGLQSLTIDSLYFRAERFDFNLGDIVLKAGTKARLDEIVVYAEKPLIQSKEGNITFNAGESALSQGSNASDLLTQVPLVTKDPDGKMLVRGKEPKILIDDKPVELNMQQLQDLLESLPGSSIEKIEVMTNPPPQYANEQGGVINIVLRKNAVATTGRLSVFAGTRGEAGVNGSFLYRKSGFSLNANAGFANNEYRGNGFSSRQNNYADSSNFFKTRNAYQNQSYRPNIRISADYEIRKEHLLNFVFHYNRNRYDNVNQSFYQNINRFGELYRLSQRNIGSNGYNDNPNLSLNYTYKAKTPGEVLRVFANYNLSGNESDRNFYQQFLNADYSFTGTDSTQRQSNNTFSKGLNVRLAYDRPLFGNKTFLSIGGFRNHAFSDVDVQALYKRKTDGAMLPLDLLGNRFRFFQTVTNVRLAVKQFLGTNFSTTVGVAEEKTAIHFDLLKAGKDTSNRYWTLLPFFNVNKLWASNLNLTFSYRRSIRRPGIYELNPTRDFSDPYNIRAGNPGLLASTADNFDLVLGRSKNGLYANVGVGYNLVNDIFNPIRTLLPDGTTEIIWQNISGRKEYEISTWSGYSFARKLRANVSASYTYNQYGDYDKQTRKYHDGGSFTSNLNTNYVFRELYTLSGNFTFNRFANPQGTVRSNVSMNLGLQAKLFGKKMTVALNMIDPFRQQENRTFTYGPNYTFENYNSTQSRNYRLSLGYNFTRSIKKRQPATSDALQKLSK
jgi:hypothetical protein